MLHVGVDQTVLEQKIGLHIILHRIVKIHGKVHRIVREAVK